MIILGINSYHPDSSAAVMIDGELIAACEEERFKRIKHFTGFPLESIRYCLKEACVSIKDVDYIAIPRDPYTRLFKKLFYSMKIPGLAKKRLSVYANIFQVKQELSRRLNIDDKEIKAVVVNIEHHRAHLASSFFVSGFDEAFLFSADAMGDFASTVWGIGRNNKIRILGETGFPHSLGFYYTAITQYLGFLEFGDEYKVMGLAAYGEPAFEDEFKKILKIENYGFGLGLKYFSHHKKLTDMNFKEGHPNIDLLFSAYLEKRLGRRRKYNEPLEKRHKDIAFSLQKRLEEAILFLLKSLSPKGIYNLCLSGGVAFNCVANGKIFGNTPFSKVYIPPATGDAGLAIGAAFYLWNQTLNKERRFYMESACWGSSYSEGYINNSVSIIKDKQYKLEKVENEELFCNKIAEFISKGKIVGWFQGRMEWGPRALGNRSILADPARKDIKDVLNNRIKYREPFRPFAPSILKEDVKDYFKNSHPSPFMLFAHEVKEEKKKTIPAVVHVDGTARLQTVDKNINPLYWKLINEFKKITGIPILLNTSFNENEPIACKPEEAIDCFLRTKMDVLAIGPFIIKKDN